MKPTYSHGCISVNSESPLQPENFGCRVSQMVDGGRLSAQMKVLGMSQSELARRVGLAQQTIYKLITGASRSSAHLHVIARELQTTPAYLTGEIDDPDEGALPPPPAPRVQLVMMPVSLPSEDALAEMYEGQLRAFAQLRGGELARALARRLPRALARLQAVALYTETDDPVEQPAPPELAAIDRHAPRQARRT